MHLFRVKQKSWQKHNKKQEIALTAENSAIFKNILLKNPVFHLKYKAETRAAQSTSGK